jgi:hypothetical protein
LEERDVGKIRQICHDLVGRQFLSPEWDRLKPYLADSHGFERVDVTCSGSCYGEIKLKDDLNLHFKYANFPAKWLSGIHKAPVESLSLLRRGETLSNLR